MEKSIQSLLELRISINFTQTSSMSCHANHLAAKELFFPHMIKYIKSKSPELPIFHSIFHLICNVQATCPLCVDRSQMSEAQLWAPEVAKHIHARSAFVGQMAYVSQCLLRIWLLYFAFTRGRQHSYSRLSTTSPLYTKTHTHIDRDLTFC